MKKVLLSFAVVAFMASCGGNAEVAHTEEAAHEEAAPEAAPAAEPKAEAEAEAPAEDEKPEA